LLAFHVNLPVHHFYQSFGNGKAQPRALNVAGGVGGDLVIIKEKVFNVILGYAHACVADSNIHPHRAAIVRAVYAEFDASLAGVFDGVGEKIGKYLFYPKIIAVEFVRKIVFDIKAERYRFFPKACNYKGNYIV